MANNKVNPNEIKDLNQLIDELLAIREANPERGTDPICVWVQDGDRYPITMIDGNIDGQVDINIEIPPSRILMPVETIMTLLKSDLVSYSETLLEIEKDAEYFTKNNNLEQHYWTDWFNGSDMKNWYNSFHPYKPKRK